MAPTLLGKALWRKAAAWLLAAVALGGVFLAYLDPHTVVDLSNRLWSCFG